MPNIRVGNANLYYREAGAGSPLLLIHGTGGHADLFGAAIPPLAVHHRVICYDRRGHGRSGREPAAVSGYLRRQAGDAAALLESLGAAPAAVVGWSMGGVIALCLALERPELVSRLVLCEPPLHALRHLPLSSIAPFLKVLFLKAIGRKAAAATTFIRMSLVKPDGGNAYDDVDEETRRSVLDNTDTMLRELTIGTGEELALEHLKSIRCPVSAIIGGASVELFSDATHRLAKLLPDMRILSVPDAGHLVVVTHPDDFARSVLEGLSCRAGSVGTPVSLLRQAER